MTEPLLTEEQRANVARELYTPVGDWETRILYLYPGNEEEPLKATLTNAAITVAEGLGLMEPGRRRVTYDALSYTWGEPVFTLSIDINGHRFSITENLHSAIVHLRQGYSEGAYVWIDALCIDQSNLEEKALQIPNMYSIFKKARRVVAWLGDATACTRYAVEVLLATQPSWKTIAEQVEDGSIPDPVMVYEGIQDILNRPWLRRAWVVQEIVAARHLCIEVGDSSLDWEEFSTVAEFFMKLSKLDLSKHEGIERTEYDDNHDHELRLQNSIKPIEYLRHLKSKMQDSSLSYRYPAHEELKSLLENAVHLQATDDRDRIYALLNLTSVPVPVSRKNEGETGKVSLRIDYNATVSEVYTQVAQYYMNTERSIGLLYNIHRSDIGVGRTADCAQSMSQQQDLRPLRLPSWTPDWRSLTKEPRWTEGSSPSESWTFQEGNRLVLCGISFGKVVSVESAMGRETEHSASLKAHGGLLKLLSSENGQKYAVHFEEEGEEEISHDHPKVYRPGERCFRLVPILQMCDPHNLSMDPGWTRKVISIADEMGVTSNDGHGREAWPVSAEPRLGDVFALFLGGTLPLILRPRENDGWDFVGFSRPFLDYELGPFCICDFLKDFLESTEFETYKEEFKIF